MLSRPCCDCRDRGACPIRCHRDAAAGARQGGREPGRGQSVSSAGAGAACAGAVAAKNPHQRATEPLLALAAVRIAQERFAESEKLIEDALSRDRQHYGPEGRAVARDLSQLGNLYLRQKRYDDARPLLEQATA